MKYYYKDYNDGDWSIWQEDPNNYGLVRIIAFYNNIIGKIDYQLGDYGTKEGVASIYPLNEMTEDEVFLLLL